MLRSLQKLHDDIRGQAGPGNLANDLGGLAADLLRGADHRALDWNRVYGAWLLIGDELRLQRHFMELPAYRGKRKNAEDYWLQQLMMYGWWCRAWDVAELEPRIQEWVDAELSRDMSSLGPICRRLMDHWSSITPTQADADSLMQLRERCTRRPPDSMRDHLFFPYNRLAPELAWCRRHGLEVRCETAAFEFPPTDSLSVDPIVTEALVAVGSTHWS